MANKAIDCVKRMLKGEVVTQETSGMSKGDWREFEGNRIEQIQAQSFCRKFNSGAILWPQQTSKILG
jgi:hypothetical protein